MNFGLGLGFERLAYVQACVGETGFGLEDQGFYHPAGLGQLDLQSDGLRFKVEVAGHLNLIGRGRHLMLAKFKLRRGCFLLQL